MKIYIWMALMAIGTAVYAQPYYGQKFEPKAGIIIGAGASDKFTDKSNYTKSWSDFVAATGLEAPVYGDFMELGGGAAAIKAWGQNLKAKIPTGCMPNIGMSFSGAGIFNPSKNITKDIIAGKYDADIAIYADQLISLNRKVFLRVGLEFDLRQYGYLSIDWREAYKRVVTLMRKRTDSIAFVFCSAGMAGNGSWGAPTQLDKYWPGDDYVDWVGIDLLQGTKEFADVDRMAKFMAYSAQHRKPVMVGELTPANIGGQTWNNWFTSFFATLIKYPIIKSFTYINWDWNAEAKKRYTDWNWGNAVLKGDVAKRFAAAVKALYIANDTIVYRIPITTSRTVYVTKERLITDTLSKYVVLDTVDYKDSVVTIPKEASNKKQSNKRTVNQLEKIAGMLPKRLITS